MKNIPDPPRLSTFKRRGGGSGIPYAASRRLRSRHPDQWRSCSPTLLSYPVLNRCGPSSRHFILPSAFPLLPCVIHSPLLLGPHGSPFFPPSTHYLPRVPFLHTSTSRPKASPLAPVFPPPLGVFRHGSSSITPFTSRHSYHTPCPPRRPPCPSLKLFSCSRW
jgi:hypothetical protein